MRRKRNVLNVVADNKDNHEKMLAQSALGPVLFRSMIFVYDAIVITTK